MEKDQCEAVLEGNEEQRVVKNRRKCDQTIAGDGPRDGPISGETIGEGGECVAEGGCGGTKARWPRLAFCLCRAGDPHRAPKFEGDNREESSSSCLGRGAKPAGAPPNKDDRSKELYSQGQVVEKHSFSEDFWGTSAGDLDYVFGVSQRSISSLSLRLWNQNRLQWIGGTKTNEAHQAQGHTISLNATYDSMLSSKERFRRPIPLSLPPRTARVPTHATCRRSGQPANSILSAAVEPPYYHNALYHTQPPTTTHCRHHAGETISRRQRQELMSRIRCGPTCLPRALPLVPGSDCALARDFHHLLRRGPPPYPPCVPDPGRSRLCIGHVPDWTRAKLVSPAV
ncbi:hypothetical protein KSS87_005096 [Heliosperma pusillum]|nr:hypothetical protein KSS87_005096 [Heliosperma pusillum]